MITVTVDQDRLSEIVHLEIGDHEDRGDGMCVMEAVAYATGQKHSDTPACVCPVIATYCRRLNDMMPGYQRDRLIQYIPQLPGSVAAPSVQRQRRELLLNRAIRVFAPIALEAADRPEEAATLRSLPTAVDGEREKNELLRTLAILDAQDDGDDAYNTAYVYAAISAHALDPDRADYAASRAAVYNAHYLARRAAYNAVSAAYDATSWAEAASATAAAVQKAHTACVAGAACDGADTPSPDTVWDAALETLDLLLAMA